MAVLGTLTLNEIVIYEVDADPSVGGLAAASGSIAIMTDGSGIFHKGEGNDFDWVDHARVVPDITKEPTGFVNRTDSVLSFNENTREFTISPVSTSFDVYIKGKKLTISSPLTTTISDVDQANFIYINSSGQLAVLNAFSTDIFSEGAYTAYILWDAEDNKAIVFGEERHGLVMDSATHSYLHTTRGSQLNSGGAVSYTLGNGNSNTDAQIGLSNMVFSDEDIRININHSATPTNPHEQKLNGTAYLPLYYRSGASGLWKELTATAYPIKFGTNRAQYNQFTGTTWQLSDASANGKYLITYVFATNNLIEPVVGIIGQSEYADLNTALAQGKWDSINFGTMPFQEFKLLYRVIYKTDSNFTNAVKSAIEEVTDLRFGVDREISSVPVITDHGNLSGLGDDDHIQYHNDARGDVRYYTKAESNTNFEPKNANIQSHIIDTNNPHSVTKAQVGLGSVDNVSAASLRDRSTHTGTQLASTISDFTTAVQGVTIDAAKIDGGNVSNTEFSYLDGVTSSIQTQLDAKEPAITKLSISKGGTNSSTALNNDRVMVSNTGAIVESTTTTTTLGYLDATSSIQTQLNGKEPTLTKGNLTEATSAVLTITGGTGSVIGSGTSIQVKQATTGQNGYLSSTDWNTFNNKQASGNYITALTGDVTASGPGSVAATLSNTGVVAGTYTQVTVDAKGRVTSASNVGNTTVYKYSTTASASNTNATYTTVAQLTTASLPIGLYKFSFSGLMQSAAAASGVGVRVAPVGATVTTCYGDWHLKQAADGVNAVFHYNQLNATTNVVSASVPTVNTDMVVSGNGVFRVTVAGTVAIQIRGETNATAATLQADASFFVEPA